jgi:hypothetical protein
MIGAAIMIHVVLESEAMQEEGAAKHGTQQLGGSDERLKRQWRCAVPNNFRAGRLLRTRRCTSGHIL